MLSGSHLITMSSTAGLCGRPNISAYCATKYALNGFTEAFHVEEVVDKGRTEVPKLLFMNPSDLITKKPLVFILCNFSLNPNPARALVIDEYYTFIPA